ncbi:hypothetical protein TSUD_123680 [Trifolium subterraneum]|uniref:F-box domain-containing protein n=1 Tax=Trifolium subterraneum TaxID=3900 RepID=A0A2Z6PJK7_TRISU|nr:hypothetical protein TSUD_123680 [Trifolium subterraneum]
MMASSAKKAKVDSKRMPNWLELPIDLTKNILQRLDTIEIVTSANVCPLWWNICKDPLMWRTINMSGFQIRQYDFSCLEKICRCAIDLSRGHLEDIDISFFGTDDLLEYMAHRASYLRRLRLFRCREISNKGFSEFVKKFSLLEDLDISFNILTKDTIVTIGQCCPFLKSLNLERIRSSDCECDGQAFAIAKTMPGLCRLKLTRIVLLNITLFAIIEGCPLLESLDVKECHRLYLMWKLEETYAKDDWKY